MTKSDNVLKLRERGYVLFPLVKEGKKPTKSATGWRKAGPTTFTEDELVKGNYAVAAQAGDLFIDADPRHFTPGDKPLARLVADVGPLNTFAVRTGGGGLHLYFSKPPEVKTAYTLKAYPGIEFRREGMYIVGPGCVHPDTKKEYEVVMDLPVAPAPKKLLDLLAIPNTPFSEIEKDGPALDKYQDDAATQARFVAFLLSAPTSGSYKIACAGRDYGLSPAITLELMAAHWNPRRENPRNDAELESKVIHAYKYAKKPMGNANPAADFTAVPKEVKEPAIDWQLTANGEVKKCFYNLLNYLKLPQGGLKGVFGYNEFTGQVEFMNPAPWHKGRPVHNPMIQDSDLKLLKGYLAVKHGFEMTIGSIEEAVTNVAFENKVHPVREYLLGLKWDGVPRLDTWLQTYVGVQDSQYTRAVGRKMLCAAVARIMKPGCVFHHVVVLEGPQAAGKSQLVKALGGEWSADFSVDPSNKDTIDSMQGKWIVEMAEMSVLGRAEMSALKAFITRSTDRIRQAYGRLTREFPRQCVFIGTINPEADGAYLTDSTGNRRFWPVETGAKIDFRGVAKMRNQLFAEAVELIKRGEQIYMDNTGLENEARSVVGARHAEHPWTERIDTWLNDPTPGQGSGTGRKFVTAREVYIDALGGIDKQLARRDVVAIANVMRSLGWEAAVKRFGPRLVRGYAPKGEDELAGLI